jgi:hypothetical protein
MGTAIQITASMDALEAAEELPALSPEEGLADLLAVEAMCSGGSA